MQEIWTIQRNSDPAVPPAILGLQRFALTEVSQAADTLTFSQATDYDADPIFDRLDTVRMYRDGVLRFRGVCTGIRRRGRGASEHIDYTLSGPWWQLEQLIYEQAFTRYVGESQVQTSLARLLIGTDVEGDRLDSGEVIAEVIGYAISKGAPLQLGTVDVDVEMPYEELLALSCAEVIKRVLRWSPDVVVYFDYSTDPVPTIHFRKRTNLSAVSFALGQVAISENSINPRWDLQRDGVIIRYERTDTVDSEEKRVVITDQAGDTSDPLRTLVLYFNLEGTRETILRQAVKVESIQISSAAWWKKRHPKLAEATAITITGPTQTAVDDESEESDNDGTSMAVELVAGSIAEWMVGTRTNLQDIRAKVSYTPPGEGAEPVVNEPMALRVQGTNAQSRVYATTGSFDPAEPVPEGLAAALLSSISGLQYEGRITLVEAEAAASVILPRKVNIDGGRTEWASMAAQVYRVSYDLDSGRTSIDFGPAAHLAAGDLFQLFRNVRTRIPGSGSTRASSAASGSGSLGTRYPSVDSLAGSGGASSAHPFQVIQTAPGEVKVVYGTVNSVAPPQVQPDITQAPAAVGATQLWLAVSLNSSQAVTSVAIQNSEPGADSPTSAKIRIATISWNDGVASIGQNLSGSQQLVSCGSNHYWGRV